jgi:hypothetical protein
MCVSDTLAKISNPIHFSKIKEQIQDVYSRKIDLWENLRKIGLLRILTG